MNANLPGKNGVIDNDARSFVIDFIYIMRNIINSTGLIFGSLALHLIDVILGGLVLSRMLSSYQFELMGTPVNGSALGWLLSLVFWYVQLLLWDKVFQDGHIDRSDVPAILVAVSIALLDTFGDASSVLLATKNSDMRVYLDGEEFWGVSLFELLKQTLFWAVIIVTGGNEFINQLLTRNASKGMFTKKNVKKIVPANNFAAWVRPNPKKVSQKSKP